MTTFCLTHRISWQIFAIIAIMLQFCPQYVRATNLIADPLSVNVGGGVLAMALQADGKYVVAGQFTQVASVNRRHIARLNSDGSLDSSFIASANADIHAVAIQPDGKILIGGDFTQVNGVARRTIARLLPDGAIDVGFNAANLGRCRAIAIQEDGSIVAGGISFLTRLLPSGAPDTSFSPSSGISSGQRIYSLALQSDNKILVGGFLVATPCFGLVRLNSNGSQDPAFTSVFDLPVRAIKVLGDQKILVGGDFKSVSGTPAPYITRLLSNGSLDGSMAVNLNSLGLEATPDGNIGTVYSIELLPEGGFFAAGPVRFVSGINSASHLARFGVNGALEASFDARLRQAVYQILGVPGDRLLVGGNFNSIAGVARSRIARLASAIPLASASLNTTGVTLTETNGSLAFDVEVTAPLPVPFNIQLSFGGSATPGKDYVRPSGTLRFEPGETVKSVIVPLIDDALIESDETLVITLAEPLDPAVSRASPFTATFIIQSDDVAAQITGQPVGQIVPLGDTVTFTASATGVPAPAVEWRRNGIRIPGAVSMDLTLPLVTLKSAGNYTMRATVSNTLATTQSASLTVVDQTPMLLPAATFASATLRARYASPERPSFRWFRNNVPISDLPNKVSGTSSAALVIRNLSTADADLYSCEITTSSGSLRAADISLVVYDSIPEVISDDPPLLIPTAMVSEFVNYTPPINADPLKTPTKFTISGLPRGLQYDSVNGRIFGRAIQPGVFDNIRITPSNAKGRGTTVIAKMEILPLTPLLVGAYIANIARSALVNSDLGGGLTLNVSPSGVCTGSLRSAGATLRYRGVLETSASSAIASTRISISRGRAVPSLVLDLQFDVASMSLAGTLSQEGLATSVVVDGYLCSTALSDRQGYQTATFELMNSEDVGKETIPQGAGFLSFTVPPSGLVSARGSLPDGTPVTLSTRLSSSGDLLFYLPLYRATGSVIAKLNTSNDANRSITGSLSWSRMPQSANQRSYRAGFEPTFYAVNGGSYIPPAVGQPPMGLPSQTSNARLLFTEGLVSSAINPPDITFTLNSSNIGIFPSFAGGDNPNKVKITINRNTGYFSGQFVLVNSLTLTRSLTRTAPFKGLISRHGFSLQGKGYFMLSKLPSSISASVNSTDILSGKVDLTPAP